MLAKFVVFLVSLIVVLLVYRWFVNTPPEKVSRQMKKSALFVVAGLLIGLAVTGRLPWLFALLGGLIPFAQRLFSLLRTYQIFKSMSSQIPGMNPNWGGGLGGRGAQQNQSSNIETQFLRMSLDHDSGELSGIVLDGRYKSRRLDELDIEALLELLAECRLNDEESATLLETYLDRHYGDEWREHAQYTHDGSRQSAGDGAMTRQEAVEILGVKPSASATEIREAHRRLMQKLHPDRGGSTYLASKINKAKDVLLDEAA